MAVPRVVPRSRCLFSRSATTPGARSILPSIRIAFPQRHFASSARVWQDTVQAPSTGPLTEELRAPTGSPTRSIMLSRIQKRATKTDIEHLLRTYGYNVTRSQLRLDRFSFHNDTSCFVELGSEKEASEAVEKLNGVRLHNKDVLVEPLKPDFVWRSMKKLHEPFAQSRYFYDEGNGSHDALRPLVEGRRMMLSVQTPGWGPLDSAISTRNKNAYNIIDQYFGKYNVEAVSGLSPFFGGTKAQPRMLCFVDFKTKEDADNAARDYHDTEIENRLTWLKPVVPSPWRAHQYGKVNKALLTELQEKGVAPQETYEDKFLTPDKDAKKQKSKASKRVF